MVSVYDKIINAYALCDEQEIEDGKVWYNIAHHWAENLAAIYGIKVQAVAALAAVFSPLKSWSLNQRLVEEYLECRTCGHFSTQILKAHAIMHVCEVEYDLKRLDNMLLNIINGEKTKNFYLSIAYPTNDFSVCIDVHMLKLANIAAKNFNKRTYAMYATELKRVAKANNLLPLELQAILWVHIKNNDSIYNPTKKTRIFNKTTNYECN